MHSSKIILKLFKKEKRGSLKTWKHILPVTKSTLRPISSGVVLSGVALSLNNCVLRCVLRVFVGVFEKLILFCGPERGAHHSFSISTHHYPCISLGPLIKKSTSLIEVL